MKRLMIVFFDVCCLGCEWRMSGDVCDEGPCDEERRSSRRRPRCSGSLRLSSKDPHTTHSPRLARLPPRNQLSLSDHSTFRSLTVSPRQTKHRLSALPCDELPCHPHQCWISSSRTACPSQLRRRASVPSLNPHPHSTLLTIRSQT